MRTVRVIGASLGTSLWQRGGALLCVLVALFVLGQPGGSPRLSAQDKEAEYAKQMTTAGQLLATRKYEQAIEAYKKANSLKGDASTDALIGLSLAYQAQGAFKNAVAIFDQGIKVAGDNLLLVARFRNQRGLVLVSWTNDHADLQKLKDAESDFRAVLAATDAVPVARYNLGIALLKQNRDDEGIHELAAYVDRGGRAPEVERARTMIDNPRRARENFAADFSITTLEGESLAMKGLAGKVVLLDFWGTWCPPCRAATPHLVDYYKKMAKNPDFVMIGVACDEKIEADWRAYIQQNQMKWPEYLDTTRKVQAAYSIRTFPNYVVIDGDGIIRAEKEGWSSDTMPWLEDAVSRALKALKSKGLFERPTAALR